MTENDCSRGAKPGGDETAMDEFLLEEGFDLIAAFRAIRSEDARKAIIRMTAAVVQAENDARKDGHS
jgi:Cdc6-like AAA superfamily ATPase